MIRHHILASGAMALVSVIASAQDLNTSITVQHEVVPEERAATRLRLFPSISLPQINPGRLPAATTAATAPLTPFINSLEPAPFAASLSRLPWRGYAVLGYGPTYNLAASAGYRFVENDKVTANAYMQFDGMKYSSEHPDADYRGYGKAHLHNNSFAVGADTEWKPMAGASLSGNVLYRFSAYNFPLPVLNQGKPYLNPEDCFVDKTDIDANGLEVNATWRHQAHRKFTYTVNAGYGLQKFGRIPGAVTENRGNIGVNLTYDHGKVSHWTLASAMQLVGASANGADGLYNKGVVTIHPSYLMTLKHFTAKIGVKVDVHTGNYNPDNAVTGYIYPDLLLLWQPNAFFSLYGKMDGRTDVNSFASLYEAQPYTFPILQSDVRFNPEGNLFGFSHIYNFEIGTTIGPWRGAAMRVFAGVDLAHNWLMPGYVAGYWGQRNVAGGHVGVEAGYSFRSYLDLSAKVVFASSPDDDFEVGYYLWRDHARCDFSVKATVRPIEPLAISLGYHLRTHRAKPALSDDLFGDSSQDLGTISDLNAAVSYSIDSRWSVFINGENLLNHRYYLGPAIPSRGIRGMVGATLKF